MRDNPSYSTEDRKREFARVMFNPKYRDALMTEDGKKHCRNQQNLINMFDLNPTVLCSPHRASI